MTSKHKPFKICLTGGGTAGHVMPHLALLPLFRQRGWDIFYIGTNGIEKGLITRENIKFKAIAAGKLRRYFAIQNFFDIFLVALGFLQSFFILFFNRPSVVFSKGGFVSVPVVVAAWILKIPVVSHESDRTPGLANKITLKLVNKILYTFSDTIKFIPKNKAKLCGLPIRDSLLSGSVQEGLRLCNFKVDDKRPVILVMGGSLGAQKINETLKLALDDIIKNFRLIHITGKGKGIDYSNSGSYVDFEYISDELKHIFATTDLVIARSGANSIFEFLALQKPMLLIPLEAGSRGDQVENAKYFEQNNWAHILRETSLSKENLMSSILKLDQNSEQIKKAQSSFVQKDVNNNFVQILQNIGTQESTSHR